MADKYLIKCPSCGAIASSKNGGDEHEKQSLCACQKDHVLVINLQEVDKRILLNTLNIRNEDLPRSAKTVKDLMDIFKDFTDEEQENMLVMVTNEGIVLDGEPFLDTVFIEMKKF